MSSYLAAVAVGQFEYVEGSADGIPIRVYTTPGRKQLASFALESAENILRYYNRYFTIQYPYEKLDLIALPDFSAGAMENTACITFREALLLVDEPHASLAQRKRVASVVAHEMAHQWFGDLVTMQWWDDVWLNEGFATWMSSKPVQAWKPEWNAQLDDVHDSLQALSLDSLANTRPIHQAAETPTEIVGLFDEIAYDKAAAVLLMLETYLGPETFQRGVNQYLKAHAQANATAGDFWDALAQASKKPVDTIMPTFVNQPGAPMVSVKSQCAGNSTTVILDQRRYFYDRSRFDAGSDHGSAELWKVPICVKAKAAARDKAETRCQVLSEKDEKFTLAGCAAWVLGNAGAEGYYRSSYQPQNEHALADDVETALTPAERIMLLADVWASVRVGREPIGDYLELAEGMRAERNPAVMQQLLGQLDYIGAYLANAGDRGAYQLWVRRLLAPAAKDLGLLPKPGESDEQKLLRTYVLHSLGATGGDPAVQAEARKLAHQALENPASADPELTPVFFSMAAASGDVALYDELLAKIKDNQTPEEYDLYLRTLAHFSSPPLLQRTLEYAISSAVRSQDAARLAARVMENPAGKDLAWNFVRSHWSDIAGAGGPFANAELVKAAGSFCEAALGDEVKAFFSAHPALTVSRVLNQSLERINYCVDLKSQQEHQLAAWLQQHDGAAENENRQPAGDGQRSIIAPQR
jgi:aminopeptidase N